jgi:hypothetical protein
MAKNSFPHKYEPNKGETNMVTIRSTCEKLKDLDFSQIDPFETRYAKVVLSCIQPLLIVKGSYEVCVLFEGTHKLFRS